jgi:CubicO group peptidase (beta-lactamase class C family)
MLRTITKLTLVVALLFSIHSNAQLQQQIVSRYIDSSMHAGIRKKLIPGSVVALVSPDSIYLVKGYGLAKLEGSIPVDPNTTLFQLGSVGKLFTAISVLQELDTGHLNLDRNVNEYLTDWKINIPFNTPVTLRNLLTHSAGFDERVVGYMARKDSELLPLGEHLRLNMPTVFEEPGTHINYSNYSYALAGHLVEIASKEKFQDYIQKHILKKLGMSHTTYYLPDNYNSNNYLQYANGYQLRDEFNEVKVYPRHALPAGGVISTGSDMAKFLQVILRRDTSLLSTQGYELLLTQQFTNHKLLPGYTLGMEVQNFNGTRLVGKGGNIPGFLSMVFIFPDDDIALFISVNTQTDNFLEQFFDGFIHKFFPQKEVLNERDPSVIVEDYTGVYLSERTNHKTFEGFFLLFDGQFRFWKSEDGNLACYQNGIVNEYVPIQPDVFQQQDSPDRFIIFSRDKNDHITNMFKSYVLGGLSVPATYKKASWYDRPHFLNDEYPFVLLFILSYLLLPLAWLVIKLVRAWSANKLFMIRFKMPAVYHAVALAFVLLLLFNVFDFWVPLLKDKYQLLFGISENISRVRIVNTIMALSAILLAVVAICQWIRHDGNILVRVYYSLFSLAALSYIILLAHWDLLRFANIP